LNISFPYWLGYRPADGSYEEADDDLFAGVLYGAMSYGTEFFNVGGSLGMGHLRSRISKWPFYSAHFTYRYKNRSFLRAEIMGGGTLGSFADIAIRKMHRKATWDIGWIFPTNRERSFGLTFGGPYIGLLSTFRHR